jgi:hypothetical protein
VDKSATFLTASTFSLAGLQLSRGKCWEKI